VSAALEQALLSHDLKLNICYCSVVGECWKTDLATISLNPQPVRACARPQVPFDLRHPTRSKPHHRRCHSSAATSPTLLSMRDIKHRAMPASERGGALPCALQTAPPLLPTIDAQVLG